MSTFINILVQVSSLDQVFNASTTFMLISLADLSFNSTFSARRPSSLRTRPIDLVTTRMRRSAASACASWSRSAALASCLRVRIKVRIRVRVGARLRARIRPRSVRRRPGQQKLSSTGGGWCRSVETLVQFTLVCSRL